MPPRTFARYRSIGGWRKNSVVGVPAGASGRTKVDASRGEAECSRALRRIVEEVSAARHRDDALAIIVRRVRDTMRVDACSVYLIDAAGNHFVLMATDGLNPAQVGIFRFGRTEGLVGLSVNGRNRSTWRLLRTTRAILPEPGGTPLRPFLVCR